MLQIVQANRAACLHFNRTGCRGPAGCPANVKRTHRQLGAWLTNRLCSHHTNRLAIVDHVASCQVTTVALGTDTETGFATDSRAHNHLVNAGLLQQIDQFFIEQGTLFDDQFITTGLVYMLRCNTTQYTFT